MQRLIHHGKRILRIAGGMIILIFGLILMIPGVPGPGFPFVIIGLSILAVDFVWAHRLKTKLKDHAGKIVDKVRGKPASSDDKPKA
jgi:membrane protein implicated in regulation of membrane protease activity